MAALTILPLWGKALPRASLSWELRELCEAFPQRSFSTVPAELLSVCKNRIFFLKSQSLFSGGSIWGSVQRYRLASTLSTTTSSVAAAMEPLGAMGLIR